MQRRRGYRDQCHFLPSRLAPAVRLAVLLVDGRLSTTLQSLALVMLSLELCLIVAVSGHSSDHTPDGASNTVCDAAAEVAQLAAGLLCLAFGVLLLALLLQTLEAKSATDSLLARADSLVPYSLLVACVGLGAIWLTGTLLAVWVVGRNAGAGD